MENQNRKSVVIAVGLLWSLAGCASVGVRIWKKQSHLEPTISKFIDLLVAELKSP
jgi:uncharacterized membrane protein HdeD (DUF308 family)